METTIILLFTSLLQQIIKDKKKKAALKQTLLKIRDAITLAYPDPGLAAKHRTDFAASADQTLARLIFELLKSG